MTSERYQELLTLSVAGTEAEREYATRVLAQGYEDAEPMPDPDPEPTPHTLPDEARVRIDPSNDDIDPSGDDIVVDPTP